MEAYLLQNISEALPLASSLPLSPKRLQENDITLAANP